MGKLKIVTAVAGLTAAVTLSGCTTGQDDTAPPSRTTPPHSTTSPTSDRAEHVPGESVTKAPALLEGKVKAQTANAHGNQELEIRGGIKAGPLSILVNCQGDGTVKVSVQALGLSFSLECADGEVSSTLNKIDLERPRGYGTVNVTAPSNVRWAVTIGQ
ncbi:hypothetical protein ACWEBX_26600 [Streptomyces sp. NPDC005070]